MVEKELEVLKQYDIDVKSAKKVRGAILFDTKQGLFLLKAPECSAKQIPVIYDIQLQLKEQGYSNIDLLYENKEKQLVSNTEEGEKYILKQWFAGRECDIRKESDILQGVKNLAIFHHLLKQTGHEDIRQKESLEQEYFRHNRELKKVRMFVRDRVGKGEFEFAFLHCFDAMFEWAELAKKRLEQSSYKKMLEESIGNHTIAHGDYNYHNVLMLHSGMATTNFEKCYQGIQVDDLYYFLRKAMEKNQWSVPLGDRILEAYNRICPLSQQETEYISICMAYPEKFWKIANSYYRSRKSWISSKSLEKLETAIQQTEKKKYFLQEIFQFQL